MNRFFILATTIFCLQGPVSAQNIPTNSAHFTVQIGLPKDSFSVDEDIVIKIVLTNFSLFQKTILFDMPRPETFGPAETSVILINTLTGKSVIKYPNKRMLESQVYSKEDLEKYYQTVKPGQSLTRQYSLFNLATIDSPDYGLAKGTYEIQLSYGFTISNRVIFTVR